MIVNPRNDRGHERGSAMVIAMLVSVILTLLGVSYLLMAETENRISENERLSDQARRREINYHGIDLPDEIYLEDRT